MLACVELLLSHGASFSATERHKMTALMFAAKEGRLALVRRLLEAGAGTAAQDNKGYATLDQGHHVLPLGTRVYVTL